MSKGDGACAVKNMRVLHCAETIKGGIASYMRELITLQSADFGAANVAVLLPFSQVPELPVPQGVRVVTFDDSAGRVGNAMRLASVALKLAKSFKPSVVHVHSTFAGATVRPVLAAGCRSARIVYCAHGWAWDRPMSAFGKWLVAAVERVLAIVSDRIVCISDHEWQTANAAGLPAKTLVVVRNAVNAHTATPLPMPINLWPAQTRRLLYVGRLDRQKGVDVLLGALLLLGDQAHAVIAGATVWADGSTLKLPQNATHVGWVTPGQLETLFAQAQILVVPSRWEGFGLVAAEAMRAGVPVVATAVGGLPEVVEHGVTGLIVAPDSPEALADAIRRLTDADLHRMGVAGRKRVTALFTMDRLHQELASVYREVTQRG
jgi:glycosyltransferase involved in cell wall biosynthesis